MNSTIDLAGQASGSTSEQRAEFIRHAIEHAKHFLPSQGPIEVFIHHNTLHAFEDQAFDRAVIDGFHTYGAQPYWRESKYREELEKGRIQESDLYSVLSLDLGPSGTDEVFLGRTRVDLRFNMLVHPVQTGSDGELKWLIAESDALEQFRTGVESQHRLAMIEDTRRWILRDLRPHVAPESSSIPAEFRETFRQFSMRSIENWNELSWQQLTLQLLWKLCLSGTNHPQEQPAEIQGVARHRDILLEKTGFDCDEPVHDLLIRFSSSFLDQGFAAWSVPNRDDGFYTCFLRLYAEKALWTESWLRPCMLEMEKELGQAISPLESIARSLDALGVGIQDCEEYIKQTLLALPGWTGMVEQMAFNASWTLHPAPKESLEEFLAIRLLLDRYSALHCIKTYTADSQLTLSKVLTERSVSKDIGLKSNQQRAFDLFQVAQRMGWSPRAMYELGTVDRQRISAEVERFDEMERRRVFHLAYEHRYRVKLLDAISEHSTLPLKQPAKVSFQVITCIDDREESFRRHLEELDPNVETFGAAGFFSVPMYFRGVADAHFIPLCPVIMKPKNFVEEVGPLSEKQAELRRAQTRLLLGKASQSFHLGSRSLFSGVLTALFGFLNAFPMVARVLFPRLTSQIRNRVGRLVRPSVATQLRLERGPDAVETEKGVEGFTLEEMAAMIERLTGDLGMQNRFAPLVIVFGHGSSSLNNPHESAYNCGACGGGQGGPNARAVAQMANDPRVRAILKQRGLTIPDATLFVGGFHNTCDDSIQYLDVDRIPPNHYDKFLAAKAIVEQARKKNAHERARRFYSLNLSSSSEEALRHVERRAEDLAQVRPEYNHATNAACFVGRRGRTRGLFMDRRCFLTSYDPTTDDASTSILLRIMQAVIPVCGGISLEYYFSTVDNVRYGCGTKLPHNITSMIGVMEGATSDLRTGLSQQMVEIHEPVRILFIVESKPEALISIMERNSLINTFIRNQWVQIATLDPDSNQIHLFQGDRFHLYEPGPAGLPTVNASLDWYLGWREPLGFAKIDASTNVSSGNEVRA